MIKEERDLLNFIQEWQSNPIHWKNNERRFKKLPTLRKPLNCENRLLLPRLQLYTLINSYIEKRKEDIITNTINCCIDIRDIK